MIKRPFIGIFIALILGELLGMKFEKGFLLLLIVAAVLLYIYLRYINLLKELIYLVFIIFIIIGISRVLILNVSNKKYDREHRLKSGAYLKEYLVEVKSTKLKDMELLIETNRFIFKTNNISIKKGDKLIVSGKLENIETPSNFGDFDSKLYYKSKNIDYILSPKKISIFERGKDIFILIKEKLKKKLKYSLNEKEYGLMIAILLGDREGLDKDLYDLFKNNGIAHILAISGLHISLIGLGVYNILRKNLKFSYFYSGFVSTIFLFVYANIVGDSAGVYRAVTMLILVFISSCRGRDYDLLSSLFLVAIILCLKNPYILYQSSFILSFMAVFSIGIALEYISEPLSNLFTGGEIKKEKKIGKIMEGISVSLALQLINLPIIAYFFYYVPIYAIFLNILVLPLMSILCISGFILFLPYILCISDLAKANISFIIYIYQSLCIIFTKFYKYRILFGRPSLLKISLYYSFLFVAIFILNVKIVKSKNIYRYLVSMFLSVIFGISILLFKFSIRDEIYYLHIRKGLSTYMNVKNNDILVDVRGKNTKSALKSFLSAKGVQNIDYLFISALDEEELREIVDFLKIKDIKIDNIVMNIDLREDLIYKKLIDKIKNSSIKLIFLDRNEAISVGDSVFFYTKEVLNYKKGDFNAEFKAYDRKISYKNSAKYYILEKNDKIDENIYDLSKMGCISIYLGKNSCNLKKFRREDEKSKRRYKK